MLIRPWQAEARVGARKGLLRELLKRGGEGCQVYPGIPCATTAPTPEPCALAPPLAL